MTVTHNFNSKYVLASVYDDADRLIFPTELTLIDANSFTVDLTGFTGTISGTWNVVTRY